MKAKDRIMSDEQIDGLIGNAPEFCSYDFDYERYFIKAGIREVVEWLDYLKVERPNTGKIRFVLDIDPWPAKLKERGIE